MGGRLHQLAPAAFLDTVPGPEPSAAQRLRFDKPMIGKQVNSQRKLAQIFVRIRLRRISSIDAHTSADKVNEVRARSRRY